MKGKVITVSTIPDSGKAECVALFDQLLIIHYSLLITHYSLQWFEISKNTLSKNELCN
jgi:hypothetical protein